MIEVHLDLEQFQMFDLLCNLTYCLFLTFLKEGYPKMLDSE